MFHLLKLRQQDEMLMIRLYSCEASALGGKIPPGVLHPLLPRFAGIVGKLSASSFCRDRWQAASSTWKVYQI